MKSDAELKFLDLLHKPIKSKEEVAEMERWSNVFFEELRQETKDLLYELKSVGSNVHSIWDLVNTKESYPEAIDILVKHVSKPYHDKNKEGLIRALTVKEAKGKANAILIKEYDEIPKEKHNLRWIIGNTIYVIINKEDIEGILPMVLNSENGMSRYRFVQALEKVKSEKAEEVLIKLLDDSEMALYAVKALGRLKSKNAEEKIRMLCSNTNEWISKEAKAVLIKIS